MAIILLINSSLENSSKLLLIDGNNFEISPSFILIFLILLTYSISCCSQISFPEGNFPSSNLIFTFLSI